MQKMNNQVNPERGALIHSTRPNPKWRRILAVFLTVSAFCVPGILLAWYLQLTVIAGNLEFNSACLALMLITMSVFSVGLFMIGQTVMQPRFSIYQQGLTKIIFPIFTNKEGDFVRFAAVESFSLSKSRRTCVIMLHEKASPLYWHSRDPKDITAAAEALRENGIPETD